MRFLVFFPFIPHLGLCLGFFWNFSIFFTQPPLVDIYRWPLLSNLRFILCELAYLAMENKLYFWKDKLWNCTGFLWFCLSLLAYTQEHNPCGCHTRENFVWNLTKMFFLRTSKGFFYVIQLIFIHRTLVWNLDRRILPREKFPEKSAMWLNGGLKEK